MSEPGMEGRLSAEGATGVRRGQHPADVPCDGLTPDAETRRSEEGRQQLSLYTPGMTRILALMTRGSGRL